MVEKFLVMHDSRQYKRIMCPTSLYLNVEQTDLRLYLHHIYLILDFLFLEITESFNCGWCLDKAKDLFDVKIHETLLNQLISP